MKAIRMGLVLAVVIAGAALWLWPSKPAASSTPRGPEVPPGTNRVQLPGGYTGLTDPRWKEFSRQEKADPLYQWKRPISFYGKVLDEREQPVEGATISLGWKGTSSVGSGDFEKQKMSDANGLFSFTGERGRILVVRVSKQGYYNEATRNPLAFDYAAFWEPIFHVPDPAKPVVFHLRKKGEAEPLVRRNTLYGLRVDGTPQFLDLRTGRKTTGGTPTGDLRIELVTTPASDPDRPNWVLSLQAMGKGGLVESHEEFMLEAPADGYQNSLRFEQTVGSPGYKNDMELRWFVRLADGKTFARIGSLLFSKYNDGAAIRMVLYLNPSGSRNLEYDPQKEIKPAL